MHRTRNRILAIAMAVLLTVPMMLSISPATANAEITDDSRGSIVISDVRDNDEFTAIRIINTTFENGMQRTFAPGFSYGSNAAARSDSGLDAYLGLTADSAIKNAAAGFAAQVSDSSEKFTTRSADGKAVFDGLPMGQYLILGTSADGSLVYQNMLGTVEPTLSDGGYIIAPYEFSITAKPPTAVALPPSDDSAGPVPTDTVLEIKKVSDADTIYRYSDVQYTILVNPAEYSKSATNVVITDSLTDASIAQGMKLNRDLVITHANGTVINDAEINYLTDSNNNTIGFEVTVPGELVPGDTIIVTYTGATDDLVDNPVISNRASVGSEEFAGIADELIMTSEEENIDPDITPLEQFVRNVQNVAGDLITQTGDKLPYIFGGVAIAAIVIILLVRKRRKDR